MNYQQAKDQAQANANTFARPYYVLMTSDGIRVERDKPSETHSYRIIYTAQPTVQS